MADTVDFDLVFLIFLRSLKVYKRIEEYESFQKLILIFLNIALSFAFSELPKTVKY